MLEQQTLIRTVSGKLANMATLILLCDIRGTLFLFLRIFKICLDPVSSY
jgi:hypothetical protein